MRPRPQLALLQAVADPDPSTSEDRWGFEGNRVWVIDGASGLAEPLLALGGLSDAAWLAEVVDRLLADTIDIDLNSAVELTCDAVAREFRELVGSERYPREALPTASFVVVELADGEWQWVAAGDCTAFDEIGTMIAPDPRLVRLDEGVLTLIGSGHRRGDEIVEELLRANRRKANREDGYPVLGPGCVPREFYTGKAPAAPDGLLLLATDGFSRLVDTFHLRSADAVARVAQAVGLDALMSELRAAEAAVLDGSGPAVLKGRDDATSVLVRAVPR